MQKPQIIEKKTLETLVQKNLLVKLNKNQYEYRSTNNYIKMLFSPGDLLLPPEQQSLGSHTVEHTVASLVNQARDMLDCYNFYQLLSATVNYQWFSEELDQNIKRIAKNSHATVPMLTKLAKQYYQFLQVGYPTWEHQGVAKQYGISIQTLKKYLKEMGLYDAEKQKHKGNPQFNKLNSKEDK